MRNERSSTLLLFKKLLYKIFIETRSDLAKQDIKAKNLAVKVATTTATSIGHQLTKMSYNWCRALKAQKTPLADSTEHSQWEVVAASVFAIPLLQSNDPRFTDLQHSIYW